MWRIFIFLLSLLGLFEYLTMTFSEELYLNTGRWYIIIIILLWSSIFISTLIYFYDRLFTGENKKKFKGSRMFFGYGKLIGESTIHISPEEGSILDDPNSLKKELIKNLRHQFEQLYCGEPDFRSQIIEFHDLKQKKDSRQFYKVSFKTQREGKIIFFIRVEQFGGQITIFQYTFLKGFHHWDDVFSFISSAPLHFWFWILKWIRGRYSLVARLDKKINNSTFELIDLQKILTSISTNYVMNLKRFVTNNRLYSKELEDYIVKVTQNAQYFNLSNSPGNIFKSISLNVK